MLNRCFVSDGFFCSIELLNHEHFALLSAGCASQQKLNRCYKAGITNKKLYFYIVEQVKRFRIPIF